VCTKAQMAKGMAQKMIQAKKRNESEHKKRANPEKKLNLSIKRWHKIFMSHEEMKSVLGQFLTLYNAFEIKLQAAIEHVNHMNKWKNKFGLTDIKHLNRLYNRYNNEAYCSHCLKKMI